MVYYSELIGKGIFDFDHKKIGVLKDFCFKPGSRYAVILGIVVQHSGLNKMIAWNYVAGIGDNEADELPFCIYLNKTHAKTKFSEPAGPLLSTILDKQIIDINGVRVVRVNDILLGKVGRKFAVIGVSTSTHGLLRRLGIPWLQSNKKDNIILWKNVAPISSDIKNVQLKDKAEMINELHPGEIADLIRDLSLEEKLFIFNNLSNQKAARALLKSQPEVMENVFKTLSMKRIAAMLEAMPTHESAAILSMMPMVNNAKVLKLMKPGIADKIRKILKYEKRTAGALMSTRYISVGDSFEIGDVIETIKKTNPKNRHILYIYITDDDNKLKGVISLKFLVFYDKNTQVKDIMKTDIITVGPNTDIDDIFNLMSKYDLAVLPVVDKEMRLLGVIRVHDMFEILVPNRIKNERLNVQRRKNGRV